MIAFPCTRVPCRLDVIANLELQGSGVEDRRAFAHKIAVDLFQCVFYVFVC